MIGSYDQRPFHPGMVSQYRNLLHSHVHQTSAGEVSSFWAGCGAVRRDVFFAVGSFDEAFRFPSVEDVEFGWRVHRAGYRILLDPSIQVTHRKEWTLRSMLLTDFARRSIPWTMLAWSGAGLPRNLNFTWGRRASVALATIAAVTGALAFFDARLLVLAAAAFLAMTALNFSFLRWLHVHRGGAFLSRSMVLQWLHYLTQSAGFVVGTAAFLLIWSWCRLRPGRPCPRPCGNWPVSTTLRLQTKAIRTAALRRARCAWHCGPGTAWQ